MEIQTVIPSLEVLTKFLIKAKLNTYAGDGKEVEPERPGFKELAFKEGDWEYRDSYTGFYCVSGQEIVRFRGTPIWNMAYSGGMTLIYRKDKEFAKQTFNFLKKALSLVEVVAAEKLILPVRGPCSFSDGDWKYWVNTRGDDITNFTADESVDYKHKRVFEQKCIGGLVIGR